MKMWLFDIYIICSHIFICVAFDAKSSNMNRQKNLDCGFVIVDLRNSEEQSNSSPDYLSSCPFVYFRGTSCSW